MSISAQTAQATFLFESTDKQSTLLELYTSEGCSSCPPAEKWLNSLQSHPELWKSFVPIAFHVNYWDYLGWKDQFADPNYTKRQKEYSRAWKSQSVYTPGFVNNGMEYRHWFQTKKLPHPSNKNVGQLRLESSEKGYVSILFTPASPAKGLFSAQLSLLGFDLSSQVTRGENSGKNLKHQFVALSLNKVALTTNNNRAWTGQVPFPKNKFKSEKTAMVAWVHREGALTPIQATGGWLN
ncbi:MAG: DUF1223 domain-containing protein [Verrucomicrobiota bacterium]